MTSDSQDCDYASWNLFVSFEFFFLAFFLSLFYRLSHFLSLFQISGPPSAPSCPSFNTQFPRSCSFVVAFVQKSFAPLASHLLFAHCSELLSHWWTIAQSALCRVEPFLTILHLFVIETGETLEFKIGTLEIESHPAPIWVILRFWQFSSSLNSNTNVSTNSISSQLHSAHRGIYSTHHSDTPDK